MDKIQGEQFTLPLLSTEIGYTNCEQIIVVVFDSTPQIVASFVKVASDKYPNAELITVDSNNDKLINLFFSKETTAKMLGKYTFEVQKTVGGTRMPVFKFQNDALNFKKSMIQ